MRPGETSSLDNLASSSVAHFHNVIIGGVLFGAFAGYTYWFPKAFGFRLHEGLGKAAFLVLDHRLLRRLYRRASMYSASWA